MRYTIINQDTNEQTTIFADNEQLALESFLSQNPDQWTKSEELENQTTYFDDQGYTIDLVSLRPKMWEFTTDVAEYKTLEH